MLVIENLISFTPLVGGESGNPPKGSRRLFAYFLAGEKV